MSNTNSLISLTDVRQFQDVKTVLAETVNNLGSLAPSAKIKTYARYRPGSWEIGTTTKTLGTYTYPVMYFETPQGGSADPYVLGDFRLYNHNAGTPHVANPSLTDKINAKSWTYSSSVYLEECDWFNQEASQTTPRNWGLNWHRQTSKTMSAPTNFFVLDSSTGAVVAKIPVTTTSTTKPDDNTNAMQTVSYSDYSRTIITGAWYNVSLSFGNATTITKTYWFAIGYETPRVLFDPDVLQQVYTAIYVSNATWVVSVPESSMLAIGDNIQSGLETADSSASPKLYSVELSNSTGTLSGDASDASIVLKLAFSLCGAATRSWYKPDTYTKMTILYKIEVYSSDTATTPLATSATSTLSGTSGSGTTTDNVTIYQFAEVNPVTATGTAASPGYIYRIKILNLYANTSSSFNVVTL